MDSYKFLGVLEIIKGSFKILPKNGKLMASIATLGLLLNSFTFLLIILFFMPLLSDMNAKPGELASKNLSDSESTNIVHGVIKDTLILLGVELSYLLVYVLICICINASIVYTSAMSLCGHDLSLKDLLLRVKRSFKRVFTTSSHNTSRSLSWIIIFPIVFVTIALIVFPIPPIVIYSILIVFGVLSFIYSLHASVVRILAYVISVIEEDCYGSDAVTKAKELVKGRRVDGFVLNLMFNLFVVILFMVYWITSRKWPSKEIVVGLFMTWVVSLGIMFMFMAYTFLYFMCKESHGEEIGLRRKLEFSKIPTTPLLNEEVP